MQGHNTGTFGITIANFSSFLKNKVDKKRETDELTLYARMMDVDKDNSISAEDIITCIKNLNNAAFFRDQGAVLTQSTFNTAAKFFPTSSKMSREKTLEVCQQVRDALALKRMQYKDLWALFDINKDNNISYAEFLSGLQQIVSLSTPILEQLFAVMDKDSNGMINYQEFLEVLR